MKTSTPKLEAGIVIRSHSSRVLRAFFDADALGTWWQTARSVTTPRVLGPYAIEWPATEYHDDVLGRLGGVFRGTIVQYDANRGFFVADAFWLPPDGEPIGPMALEVTLTPLPAPENSSEALTDVRIQLTGFEESIRWRRFYEVVGVGWERALNSLKTLLEK